jgi:hypothetical protein
MVVRHLKDALTRPRLFEALGSIAEAREFAVASLNKSFGIASNSRRIASVIGTGFVCIGILLQGCSDNLP